MLRRTEPAIPLVEQDVVHVPPADVSERARLGIGPPRTAHVAILVKNYQFGGTQRVLTRLANKLHEYGHVVQVLSGGSGPLRAMLCDGVEQIDLRPSGELPARFLAVRCNPSAFGRLVRPVLLPIYPMKALRLLRPLIQYLAAAQPEVLIAATAGLNVVASLAKRRAAVDTALVMTEHVSLDQRRIHDRRWARRFLPDLMRSTYADADAIVAVSSGVRDGLCTLLDLPRERVRCIYNPAVPDDIDALIREPAEHPWFMPGEPPVVLSAGRPGRTKDFATLLHAFVRLRAQQRSRLVLLSSAARGSPQDKQLGELRALAESLGVQDDFVILDFTDNPFRYMARAGVFASSSTSEGFGNVVAEALACGCPVVSTLTEGPAEVLDNGTYGRLVPVGDEVAMAKALLDALHAPRNSARLALRAAAFSEERAGRAYEALCCDIAFRNAPRAHVHATTSG